MWDNRMNTNNYSVMKKKIYLFSLIIISGLTGSTLLMGAEDQRHWK